eukprot:g2672.t1
MARAIATPQRGPHVADLVELEQSLEAAKQLLQKLGHLQGPARQDLLRRLKPEFQAWQEQWDTDDGALEPEEDLSEEEYWDSDGDGQDIKKARRAPPALTDDYPMVWGQHLPGYAGFNQKAQDGGWLSPGMHLQGWVQCQGGKPILQQGDLVGRSSPPHAPEQALPAVASVPQEACGDCHEVRARGLHRVYGTKTIDERRLESLMAEAAEMAPALAMIRCHAIDAGLYH